MIYDEYTPLTITKLFPMSLHCRPLNFRGHRNNGAEKPNHKSMIDIPELCGQYDDIALSVLKNCKWKHLFLKVEVLTVETLLCEKSSWHESVSMALMRGASFENSKNLSSEDLASIWPRWSMASCHKSYSLGLTESDLRDVSDVSKTSKAAVFLF